MKPFSYFFLLLTVAISGCGQPKPEIAIVPSAPAIEPTTPAISTTASPATVTNDRVAPDARLETTQTRLVVTAPAGTAEETFQKTLLAFQDGRLDDVFELLPAAYQADIENLVHEFGGKMDAEIWSKTFVLLSKLSQVMKSKKSLIMQFDLIKRAPPAFDAIKQQWDAIAEGLYQVATSQVDSIEYLKRADVRSLLSSASHLLDGVSLPKFGNVSVTTVGSNGDSTTLSYRESKDGGPTEVEFVKVDGKWLPKSIATNWSDTMRDLNARLQTFPNRVAAVKPRVMQHLDGISGILGKMQDAKSQEELNLALIELTFSIRLALLTAQEAMLEATLTPRNGNDLRIEINFELKDDEQTALQKAMFAHLNDNSTDCEFIANNGKTRCRFSPVSNAEGVVEVLRKHFAKADVRLNFEKQTIYVESK